MIQRIMGRNLKSLEIDQPLQRLNLFVGSNGVGKSARADALTLALLGYIPGVAKKNGDILARYGTGDKMFAGCELDDRTHLLRRYSRNEKGEVGQELLVNRRAAKKEEFAVALAGHRVFDLQAFLDLSDAKKIDWVFGLFPPSEELGRIDEALQTKTAELNTATSKIRTLQSTVERLSAAKSNSTVPAGTLAEVSAEIHSIEQQMANANAELMAIRLEAAKTEGQQQSKVDYDALRKQDEKVREEQFAKMRQEAGDRDVRVIPGRPPDPCEVVHQILEAMKAAGCDSCVASMVAKRALKKLEACYGSAAA